MPLVGFGTWHIEGERAYEAVLTALEAGYRHIDTATVYGNERHVGRALASSQLHRGELFVTTKLPGNSLDVLQVIEQSLTDLGLEFVDLWLIHWPPMLSYEPASTTSAALFEQMLAIRDEGLAKSIGVSNYGIDEIDELIGDFGEAPEVDQVLWSPFENDAALQDALVARDICLEGYSPLSTSRLDDPILAEIANRHEVSPAQVVLRWHVQEGIVVIPKSEHRDRIRQNIDLTGFLLSSSEMEEIASLRRWR